MAYIAVALGNGLVSLKTNCDASAGGTETKRCLDNKCNQFSKEKNGADHVACKLLSRPVDAGLRPLLSEQRAHLISSPCLPANGWVRAKVPALPAGFQYYLHTAISCVNVCNKVIQPRLPRQLRLHKNARHIFLKKKKTLSARNSHVNFHKTPKALSHFSTANRREGVRGRRQDVPQLPMGNVSQSLPPPGESQMGPRVSRQARGGCSRPAAPAVLRELCGTRGAASSRYLGNLSRLAPDDILTRASHIFCAIFFSRGERRQWRHHKCS